NTVVCRAYASHFSRVEVVAAGRVTRLLGSAPGIRSPHEGFLMRLDSPCGIVVRVESNQNFTGVIPLKIGDRINVKGEYEFYAQGGVIHWTHPDPTGHHPGGYVEVGKRVYQ
ncbi:MAG TPA: DUF3465 domain-containing protein, partial [Candidatus Baltobacteraceae bacterium]|nr:DUF3465 domain-containing protein [Candidatus Baltobacteraceae bacterium]